ncbi:hypothetical protein BT93_L0777 [Corymbia citriodora subsp. variegata]|uniref:Neprosin PEP catalytic domain-containing protein n=1 Tax=Corymbia citriodora subsp. variegata TaxID=360336 RepID=A0A8T0CP56_CORYI|nr:hypothetical protein BT93_L0777 [Corymbia citriodora subsp. variegata]
MTLNVELVASLLLFFSLSLCEMAYISKEDDLDLERQSKEGDIIDCVDINNQPALDHPLLKNHKVQIEPSLHVTSLHRTSLNVKSVIFGLRETCPIGTVPIRRVTKEDLMRARSLPKIPSIAAMRQNNMIENVKYGGGGGTTTYKLNVAPDQLSAHNMWIETGPPEHVSMIVAGWMVSPQLYGDVRSRTFAYWTGDGYRNGCYNVLCPGFVQVDREITLGYALEPTSTYGGPQYELVIHIEQDRDTGNWWLILNNQRNKVGYWPKELFLYLRNGSLHTAWGGIGIAGSNGFCPPMGSGHKPDGVFKHATVFRKLHWVRSDGKFLPPSNKTMEWVDKSHVYGMLNYGQTWQYKSGYVISFGGPGGYCKV